MVKVLEEYRKCSVLAVTVIIRLCVIQRCYRGDTQRWRHRRDGEGPSAPHQGVGTLFVDDGQLIEGFKEGLASVFLCNLQVQSLESPPSCGIGRSL